MMSEKAQRCFDQHKRYLALANEIEQKLDNDLGWACVVRFYAAVQLLNAYLIDKPNIRFDPVSSDHQKRKAVLERCPELREAPRKYRQLKDLSELVRYDAWHEFSQADYQNSLAYLAKIVAIVDPKMR